MTSRVEHDSGSEGFRAYNHRNAGNYTGVFASNLTDAHRRKLKKDAKTRWSIDPAYFDDPRIGDLTLPG